LAFNLVGYIVTNNNIIGFFAEMEQLYPHYLRWLLDRLWKFSNALTHFNIFMMVYFVLQFEKQFHTPSIYNNNFILCISKISYTLCSCSPISSTKTKSKTLCLRFNDSMFGSKFLRDCFSTKRIPKAYKTRSNGMF
jgi:hypothetical protein